MSCFEEEYLENEICPNCGEEIVLIEVRPDSYDQYDQEDDDMVLYYTCTDD